MSCQLSPGLPVPAAEVNVAKAGAAAWELLSLSQREILELGSTGKQSADIMSISKQCKAPGNSQELLLLSKTMYFFLHSS